jgi:phosphate transport system substrate-binding protein
MSEKRMNEIGRRQRFRRRLRGEEKAVSPVVATLILILIAVAAAAALYLWLVAWQGGVTKGIGSPTAQYTVTIGGSTSVYPFDQVAVSYFEGNNSDVVISNNQGGTGAGMAAVCAGQIDIGASSTAQTVSGLESADGCPATTVVTTVAYDAVDLITSTTGGPSTVATGTGVGPLESMNNTVLTAIYADASTTTTTLALTTSQENWLGTLWAPTSHTAPAWNAIPTQAGCGAKDATLQVALGNGDCTGVNLAGTVDTVSRSDASGTTQTFEARMLGATSSTAESQTFAGLSFSGCGSNNLLSDCGMTTIKTGNGNPGVISTVAGDKNALGYASDGLVRAAGSGVVFIAFSGGGQGCVTGSASTVLDCGVIPTTGATGTISAGVVLGGYGPAGRTTSLTYGYAGTRPFQYVTTSTPTGEVQRYIQFVMDPANNINIASASDEVSYYSV